MKARGSGGEGIGGGGGVGVADRKATRTRPLDRPYRRPASEQSESVLPGVSVPVPPSREFESSPTLVPPGTVVKNDDVMMLLIPGDMWNRMRDMSEEVGASGPIALVNIALERLRIALAAGEK